MDKNMRAWCGENIVTFDLLVKAKEASFFLDLIAGRTSKIITKRVDMDENYTVKDIPPDQPLKLC
jgi:hypothetical protein